jgi:hypothetical protein
MNTDKKESKQESNLNLTLNQVIGLIFVTAGVSTLIVYGIVKLTNKNSSK